METPTAKPKNLLKPNNMVSVPYTSMDAFFKGWCMFLQPFMNLTNRELDIVANMLKQRWELSKQISDPAILDTLVLEKKVRKKILEECNISLTHYYVVIKHLKEKKVIENDVINPKLIPNLGKDTRTCQLLILFKDNRK